MRYWKGKSRYQGRSHVVFVLLVDTLATLIDSFSSLLPLDLCATCRALDDAFIGVVSTHHAVGGIVKWLVYLVLTRLCEGCLHFAYEKPWPRPKLGQALKSSLAYLALNNYDYVGIPYCHIHRLGV